MNLAIYFKLDVIVHINIIINLNIKHAVGRGGPVARQGSHTGALPHRALAAESDAERCYGPWRSGGRHLENRGRQ